jgi:uncharacterized protein
MNPTIDLITLGVTDLERAQTFYEHGLGGEISTEDQVVTVRLGAKASDLALRRWDAVASEAGVEAQSSGFRNFTLSYIVDSAAAVDEVLARAERHGGTVSKPPKNAAWGYSAYVTDPDGCLWKVASSKRRPLIARSRPSADDPRRVNAREVPITIGVRDIKRAKEFYKNGLGLRVKKDYRKFVMFSGDEGNSDLALYTREALAGDAAVQVAGTGFRGFTITHIVETAERVDALLDRAARAGASIRGDARTTVSGYGGYFEDPDGNLWQVASPN